MEQCRIIAPGMSNVLPSPLNLSSEPTVEIAIRFYVLESGRALLSPRIPVDVYYSVVGTARPRSHSHGHQGEAPEAAVASKDVRPRVQHVEDDSEALRLIDEVMRNQDRASEDSLDRQRAKRDADTLLVISELFQSEIPFNYSAFPAQYQVLEEQ